MTATASPPPARPRVPAAAVVCLVLLGAAAIGAALLGAAVVAAARAAAPRIEKAKARRARDADRRTKIAAADAILDAMAARLRAEAHGAGEVPESLDEAAPKDPWGRALEYRRLSPERALLRSAGPDGKFGTDDDVRRTVVVN